MVRYSASAVDFATFDCFLDFQETREPPRNTQYPIVDFPVVGILRGQNHSKLSMQGCYLLERANLDQVCL
jgi:hypothetical protein